MKKTKDERTILKNIERGTYRNCYLVYNRKSTDEVNNQKNSIEYQKNENTRYAQHHLLPIAPVTLPGFATNGIISEKHSGFKEGDDLIISDAGMVQYSIDRPKFLLLSQYLSRGHFNGVVCLCWDRLSRNKGDDTVIRKLMRKGVDVRFVYANYDTGSAGELHMDIDGMFAQHHSRVTSEKVKLTIRNSREQGKCTYRAPIGYLNEGTMDHKPFDPERAPIIHELFKLYATGRWSLADLARHANRQGFTTVPARRRRSQAELLDDDMDHLELPKVSRPVSENQISRILNNPFYTGRVRGPNGEYVTSASHDAIVDDGLFAEVQKILRKRTVSIHYTKTLDLPMRGFARCSLCNRVYTPYMQKGILYFGVRCRKLCPNPIKNCNVDYVVKKVRQVLAALSFSDNELRKLDEGLESELSSYEEQRQQQEVRVNRQRKRIAKELRYLDDNRLKVLAAGVYSPEELLHERTKLEEELHKLEDKDIVSITEMKEMLKQVVSISELIKSVVTIYDSASLREKENIARWAISELHISENIPRYKVKTEISFLNDLESALCGPIAWFSELSTRRNDLNIAEQSLKYLVNSIDDKDKPTDLAA